MPNRMAVCRCLHHSLRLFRQLSLSNKMAPSKIDMSKTAIDTGTVVDRQIQTIGATLQLVEHPPIVAIAPHMVYMTLMQIQIAQVASRNVAEVAQRVGQAVMIVMSSDNAPPLLSGGSPARQEMGFVTTHPSSLNGIIACPVTTSRCSVEHYL